MESAEPSGGETSARRPLRTLESTKLGACAVRAPLRPHARASMTMPSRSLIISRVSAPRRLCVKKTREMLMLGVGVKLYIISKKFYELRPCFHLLGKNAT